MNDEGRPVDGWESDDKGRFAEQAISESEHQDKEDNIEEGEQLETVEELTE